MRWWFGGLWFDDKTKKKSGSGGDENKKIDEI
jgi:hypothetical protein